VDHIDNPYKAPSAPAFEAASNIAELSLGQVLFSFEGRLRRGEYWFFLFATSLAYSVVGALLMALFNAFGRSWSLAITTGWVITAIAVIVLLYLPLLWVTAALQAKRWHDRDKSAWWMLLAIVPLANLWVGFELGFLPGSAGRNSYGPPSA
jgi:uncharacterized membrane protein YhaH (DUF805 family)